MKDLKQEVTPCQGDPDVAYIYAHVHPPQDAARLAGRVLGLKRLVALLELRNMPESPRIATGQVI
jgi:hypothetical protein